MDFNVCWPSKNWKHFPPIKFKQAAQKKIKNKFGNQKIIVY